MGDLASDHDSAIRLIINEYRRLEKHNKNHKLLTYLSKVHDEGIAYSNDEKVVDEFLDKYAPINENTPAAVMLTRYYIDLGKAVDEIEGIDRFPKPKTIEEIVKTEKIEELPF